jgi:hypothetical protein
MAKVQKFVGSAIAFLRVSANLSHMKIIRFYIYRSVRLIAAGAPCANLLQR